jgi:hypothetical protein
MTFVCGYEVNLKWKTGDLNMRSYINSSFYTDDCFNAILVDFGKRRGVEVFKSSVSHDIGDTVVTFDGFHSKIGVVKGCFPRFSFAVSKEYGIIYKNLNTGVLHDA